MTTASDFIRNSPALLGLPRTVIRACWRELADDNQVPVSRGKAIQQLNTNDVVLWLFAAMSDLPAKHIAEFARLYFNLRDPDGRKAGHFVAKMIDSFANNGHENINFALLAYKSRVVLDCSNARITVVNECTDGNNEIVFGEQSVQSQDQAIGKAMTLPGKVLFDLAQALHSNRWETT